MQRHIAPAWDGSITAVALTREQWKALIKEIDEPKAKEAESLKEQLHVTVEEKTMAGVHVYLVTPDNIPEKNRKRLLVHVHGGAYVFFGGVAATGEAILMAHFAKTQVLSEIYPLIEAHVNEALNGKGICDLEIREPASHGHRRRTETRELSPNLDSKSALACVNFV
jgi:acetyl esterase/lipase